MHESKNLIMNPCHKKSLYFATEANFSMETSQQISGATLDCGPVLLCMMCASARIKCINNTNKAQN